MKKVWKDDTGHLHTKRVQKNTHIYCPETPETPDCGDWCAGYDVTRGNGGILIATCWGRNIGELIDKPENPLDNP